MRRTSRARIAIVSFSTAPAMQTARPHLLAEIAAITGEKNVLTKPAQVRAHTEELRGRFRSECLGVVLPASASEVAKVIAACARAKTCIVPQGGNTGTMGGAVAAREQIILNTRRMNRIVDIDAANYTMHVEAGCILADIRAAAHAHARLFPLSLGAQGSCQIGGNLATNAGGINVLHYGNARDLTLGIEVALADGSIWNGMSALRKDNTGYDLKNLFIGGEGTLGVITAAVLKLFPPMQTECVAMAGMRAPEAALELLATLREASADRLVTFELMGGAAVQSALRNIASARAAFAAEHAWHALIKIASAAREPGLRMQLETCLQNALEKNLLQDAVIAADESQSRRLLALREQIVEAQKFEGGSIKHDIAVPLSRVPEFLRRAHAEIKTAMPAARICPYGHMGDGNLHYNITQPRNMSAETFFAQRAEVNRIVHDLAVELGGTFSAEHGIGIAKLGEMARYKDAVTLSLYRRVKRMLDPENLFNPGKLVAEE